MAIHHPPFFIDAAITSNNNFCISCIFCSSAAPFQHRCTRLPSFPISHINKINLKVTQEQPSTRLYHAASSPSPASGSRIDVPHLIIPAPLPGDQPDPDIAQVASSTLQITPKASQPPRALRRAEQNATFQVHIQSGKIPQHEARARR